MLAYLFWHRPRPDVDNGEYEEAQRSFHATLEGRSACFRLGRLPFDGDPGYEDWYLVEDWRGMGELNERAIDSIRRPSHDRAAELSSHGWGGVYSLVRGATAIPEGVEWLDKPRDQGSDEFIAALPGEAVWRRQLVLGPGREFCLATSEQPGRKRIWPCP